MMGLEKKYRAAEDANTTRHGEKVRWPRRNRFPLVEDDDDPSSVFWVVDDTEVEGSENVNDEEEEYIPRRRPPPKSLVGSPLSSGIYIHPLSHSSSIHHKPAPTRSQSQKNTAEPEVLFAIRLPGYLKAQGASKAELGVVFDESDEEEKDDETMAVEIDHALTEMHAASAVSASASAAGTRTVYWYWPKPPLRRRKKGCTLLRPCHILVEKLPLRSSPSPPLVLNKPGSRNISVGRTTSPGPPPSAAYVIALLTMWHLYASVFVHGVTWRRSRVVLRLWMKMLVRQGQGR